MLYLVKVGTRLLDSLRSRNFWRLILIVYGVWTLFGAMGTFQYWANSMGEPDFRLRTMLILTIGDAWLKATLTVPVIIALLSVHRRFSRWPARIAFCFLLFFAFVTVHVSIRPFVLPFVVRPTSPGEKITQTNYRYREKVEIAARSFLLSDLMGFSCIIFVFNAWMYAMETQRRALNEERLAARLASAELQVLKMQLQPHFLFNTLNTIYNLAPQNSRKAQTMIARLSDLLRLSLDHVATNMVPLQQELEFLENYLDIEKTRFEERLQIVREIDPEALDAAVPNLLLQPLVENAIRHGIGKKASGGTIEIRAAKAGPRLKITITDDGRAPVVSPTSSGIGLANTRARLAQLFGEDFTFELRPVGQGTQVFIDLPFQASETIMKQEEPVDEHG